MGREERGYFSKGAERESRHGRAPCVSRGPSRGLSDCDEGSAYNMQKQRDARWCQAAKEASSVESLPFSSYGTTLRTWTGAFLLLPRPFSWMIDSSAAKPWLLLEALTPVSPCHHRPSKTVYCLLVLLL